MKRKVMGLVIVLFFIMISGSVFAEGYLVTSDLWIRAVINTVEKGPIDAVWQKGGEDTTSAGDRVIWGHFYASPSDVTWGSQNNPDLFVKIWFDHGGRLDVNFFHVSVPDIEVYSDYPHDGTPDEHGTTTMSRRYIRQYYENGQSYSDENYEDGNPPSGYSPTGNPLGYYTINDLRIGSIINTVEKGAVDAIWQIGGQDTTSRGDQVVWGHFYASPSDVTWGSENNPDLFVKIWFDVSGRIDVNYFHVSVPDIEVYSDLPNDSTYDQQGTTVMDNRYIRHEYTINIHGNDYYPIDVGNVWNYDIANVEVIDEQHTFTDGIGQRVNMTPIPGSDVAVLFFENMINDGVVFLGSYDAIEEFEDDCVVGLFVILKNIMAVGDTWNLEFLAPSSSSGTFTFLGFETVTVPAGSFIDCIKIEFTLNGEEPYTDHLYFAKDVGLVKAERISPQGHTDGWFLLVTSDDRLAELQSATIDGVSYP